MQNIMNNHKNITLNNGVEMPVLGLGTFKMTERKVVIQSVKKDLELAYRHIDTALTIKTKQVLAYPIFIFIIWNHCLQAVK